MQNTIELTEQELELIKSKRNEAKKLEQERASKSSKEHQEQIATALESQQYSHKRVLDQHAKLLEDSVLLSRKAKKSTKLIYKTAVRTHTTEAYYYDTYTKKYDAIVKRYEDENLKAKYDNDFSSCTEEEKNIRSQARYGIQTFLPALSDDYKYAYIEYDGLIEEKVPFVVTFHKEGERYRSKTVMNVETQRGINLQCLFSSSWKKRNYTNINTIESKMIEAISDRVRTLEYKDEEKIRREYTKKLIETKYEFATYSFQEYSKTHEIAFANGVIAKFYNSVIDGDLSIKKVDYPYNSNLQVLDAICNVDLSK